MKAWLAFATVLLAPGLLAARVIWAAHWALS